jgi:hypothetical protein
MDWHPHLFDDFLGTDCCIVIKSPDEFARRLVCAAANMLPGWHFHPCPIGYFDTHERRSKERLDNTISKDFRLAYQRQYRFLFASFGKIAAAMSTWNLVPCITSPSCRGDRDAYGSTVMGLWQVDTPGKERNLADSRSTPCHAQSQSNPSSAPMQKL